MNQPHTCVCVHTHAKSLHSCLFATPWTIAYQAHLSMRFPSKNTGMGCHFLLQGIFPTQGSNPSLLCLLHCRRIVYGLSLFFNSLQNMTVKRSREIGPSWRGEDGVAEGQDARSRAVVPVCVGVFNGYWGFFFFFFLMQIDSSRGVMGYY